MDFTCKIHIMVKCTTIFGNIQINVIGNNNENNVCFSLIEPIWSPDKQAKMVFHKNSFLRRYSNLKFKKFNSAQAKTARSRFFFKASPLKS